jgi:hypothetical protein
MRIYHEDCDIAMPREKDVLDELESIQPRTREKFIPTGSVILAKMWIDLVKISDTLGRILRVHYRVNGPKPTFENMNNSAEELRACKPQEFLKDSMNDLPLLKLHLFHVELFYE